MMLPDSGPTNASYLSVEIQNELISILAFLIHDDINLQTTVALGLISYNSQIMTQTVSLALNLNISVIIIIICRGLCLSTVLDQRLNEKYTLCCN